jgi:hypothetical protein
MAVTEGVRDMYYECAAVTMKRINHLRRLLKNADTSPESDEDGDDDEAPIHGTEVDDHIDFVLENGSDSDSESMDVDDEYV